MKCCFCNAVIDGMGNSIHPIKRGRNARCCDECNVKVSIPLRLYENISRHENEKRYSSK